MIPSTIPGGDLSADELAQAQELRAGIAHLNSVLQGPVYAAPARPAAVDLSRLVQEVRRLLRAVTPPTLELRFQLDGGLPPVHADGTALRQLLTHFVAAVGSRAAAAHWPLTIRTRSLAAPAWRGGKPAPALELLLGSESGQALALLRWAVASQGRSRSSGVLGIATVQQMLHDLHGAVSFVRIPGEGTAAQLLLPASSTTLVE